MDDSRTSRLPRLAAAGSLAVVLAGCAGTAPRSAPSAAFALASEIVESRHAGDDDLLTAGLGAAGLASPLPPSFAVAAQPSVAELRRRAIWTNWRGIADLAPGGGYGGVYGAIAPVAGREFHAFARLPGARQPHRVLVQVPDAFDPGKPCLVVTASSGSRGIYGAIALAGSWGLTKGCAVAYTDKGAGTGYVDIGVVEGTALDGRRAVGDPGAWEFAPPPRDATAMPPPIATKHAHSGDNPEADWGRHVRDADAFARQVLRAQFPGRDFSDAATRVIAVGVSNGGGAVLRAAELPGHWLDAVVAVSPNVLPREGGRALYDYTTQAALLMPCALDAPAFDSVALARPGGKPPPAGAQRCASLQAAGLVPAGTSAEAALAARAQLGAAGWNDASIAAGALSTSFELFRAVAVTYASAYARTNADGMPCGYAFRAIDPTGAARATNAAGRAAWWSDGSGIPPGAGVGIVEASATAPDPTFAGLACLRRAWTDVASPWHARVHAGVDRTRAALPRVGLPVIVLHGADDGLVQEPASGAAYARWAKAAGRDVRYWRIGNAQHFDAFLGLPVLATRYVPMLPYGYAALDRAWAHLDTGAPLPADADIATIPRAPGAPLTPANLGNIP